MEKKQQKKLTSWSIGVSVAASWAWGTGFIVGMGTLQQKGLIPFFIWAVANISTLITFGLLFKTGVLNRKLFSNKVLKYIALALQCIIIVLNANVINSLFIKVGLSPTAAYITTSALCLMLVAMVFNGGLRTSIMTDWVQMSLTYIFGIVLLVIGIKTGARVDLPFCNEGGISWALWSATILLTSPIGDMEMWQRAEVDEDGKAFFIGAAVFSIYVILIFLNSFHTFTPLMNVFLLLMIFAVSSATIDSATVCFHSIRGNKVIGTIVAAIICVGWGVFKKMGIIELRGKIGVVRVAICVTILVTGIVLFIINKRSTKKGVECKQ